jgi:hypothetical protein
LPFDSQQVHAYADTIRGSPWTVRLTASDPRKPRPRFGIPPDYFELFRGIVEHYGTILRTIVRTKDRRTPDVVNAISRFEVGLAHFRRERCAGKF